MAALGRLFRRNPFRILSRRTMSTVLPAGTYPTMLTPFKQDLSIDWTAVDSLVEWYIDNKVDGIFTVCQSSEMFNLTNEERLQLAQRVATRVQKRVPVLAGGTFQGSLKDQAEFICELGRHVDVPIVLSNQVASFEESDEQWMANVDTILKLTGDIPLGIYEVPVPKCRVLSAEMVRWAASTQRFVFLKDTATDLQLMREKIDAMRSVGPTPMKYFTAKLALLSSCLDLGGDGFSGICLNLFPELITWLCRNRSLNPEQAMALQRVFSIAEGLVYRKYPASAKYYLAKCFGVPMKTVCRVEDFTLSDQDKIALKHLNTTLDELQHSLGL